jgi:hypothetical protein
VCIPLDARVLDAAQGATLNLLHLHGRHTYFDLVASHPVHGLNRHNRETGLKSSDKINQVRRTPSRKFTQLSPYPNHTHGTGYAQNCVALQGRAINNHCC